MEQSERNPNQERDRGRAPGSPSVDRVEKPREPHPHDPHGEKGRDRPPDDAPRDPDDPWMGGG
jgi:hypothetical protein